MKKFIFILCLFIGTFSYGQGTFEKSYNDGNWDMANRIRQCNDKGYVILGSSLTGSNVRSSYLIKTDSLGEIKWSKYFNSPLFGNSIEQTIDGGYILSGFGCSGSNNGMTVIKTDSIGNINWLKEFNFGILSYAAMNIVQPFGNNYIIAGSYQVGSGNLDVFLLNLDANGNSVWTKTYGDGGFDIVHDMKKTNDGGFILVGESQLGYHGEYKLDVIKVDSVGNPVWARKYNEGLNARSVYPTFDNGYIILGYNYEMLLMKIDSVGNVKWDKTFNGIRGGCVIETNDKGLFAMGDNHYVAKTDSSGNIIWENNIGIAPGSGASTNCIQTNDKGLAIIGFYNDNLIQRESILFIKMDSNGCITPSIHQICGPHNVTVNQSSVFNEKMNYGTGFLNYYWSTKNGQILSGQGTALVNINWSQTGIDTLLLVVSNDCGKDSIYYSVNILDCVTPIIDSIYGYSYAHSEFDNYYVNKLEGTEPVVYNWTSDIATITTGNGTDSVTVRWLHDGTGYIKMVAENTCEADSLVRYVTVNLTSIEEIKDPQILIYPNPSHDGKFNIESKKKFEKLTIHSTGGQLLLDNTVFNGNSWLVDLSTLPKGIYILKLFSSNDCITKKLIIM